MVIATRLIRFKQGLNTLHEVLTLTHIQPPPVQDIYEGNYLGRKNCYSPESIYLEVDPCRNKGLPKSRSYGNSTEYGYKYPNTGDN